MIELLGLFCLGFAIDVAWVFYDHFLARSRPGPSALIAAVLVGGSLLGYGESMKRFWCAAAYVAGHASGTYAAVWWKRRRHPSS